VILDHNTILATYRRDWHAAKATESGTFLTWARFYADAREWIESLAREYGMTALDVASIVALTSPRMPWARNRRVAVRIIRELAQWDCESLTADDVKGILDGIESLGVTRQSRRAVARWIAERYWSGAPKVTAFRQNLLGRFNHVTIDTWMTKPFGLDRVTPKQYRELARAITALADEAGSSPAVVQAVLWGYYRQGSAWSRFDDA
jgi:hypothetical protein